MTKYSKPKGTPYTVSEAKLCLEKGLVIPHSYIVDLMWFLVKKIERLEKIIKDNKNG